MIEEVVAALAEGGRTILEIRDALRSRGRVSVTSADVTRVLLASPARFAPDGGDPPRWTLGRAERVLVAAPRIPLHAWQKEALNAWRRQGGRGVVEAVTGTGKTRLGVAAIAAELEAGGQAVVLVPTRELLHQWHGVLTEWLRPDARIGLLGDGQDGSLGRDDVLVAVVNSAREELRPRRGGGLLVADECHRYASDVNRQALCRAFPRRLGLTATFARPDDGHVSHLAPYFGPTCYRMGFERAIRDGIVARIELALVGVAFSGEEREIYEDCTRRMAVASSVLMGDGYVRAAPVGAFFEDLARLARAGGEEAALARAYLGAMQQRRDILAETPAKWAALRRLAEALGRAERALVFTSSIRAAQCAAEEVRALGLTADAVHSGLDMATRRNVLARFASGAIRVVTAPQVLDEGIDVPAADLAVVLAASRSRRQMIQRMGRVLRRKPDGRPARFVVLFVEDTVEDPARGAHEGFLDEVTAVADRCEHVPAGASVGSFFG